MLVACQEHVRAGSGRRSSSRTFCIQGLSAGKPSNRRLARTMCSTWFAQNMHHSLWIVSHARTSPAAKPCCTSSVSRSCPVVGCENSEKHNLKLPRNGNGGVQAETP